MRVRAGAATGPRLATAPSTGMMSTCVPLGRTPSDAAALASITPAGLVVDGALRLVDARDEWLLQHPADAGRRLAVACAPSAHSSVRAAAGLLDLDVVAVPGEARDRLTADALRAAVHDRPVCAAVASAGATNTGLVDATRCRGRRVRGDRTWLHVDAAYGGGADPPPVGAVPRRVRRWPRQPVRPAFHLTRRARGLPFWFALVVHGTDAFTAAVPPPSNWPPGRPTWSRRWANPLPW